LTAKFILDRLVRAFTFVENVLNVIGTGSIESGRIIENLNVLLQVRLSFPTW